MRDAERAGPIPSTDEPPAPSIETGAAKLWRRIMPLLFFCYLGSYVCRINVGFARQPMQSELGFGDAAFGFGAGIFFLGFLALEIPSNALLVRIGARRTFARVIVLWSIASGSMAFIDGTTAFWVLRFALGAAEAGFSAGVLYYMTVWFPGPIRARAIAILTCSSMVGASFAGPISAVIIEQFDQVLGLSGWRWMFLLEAMPSLIMGVIVWRILLDTPSQATWLTDREREAMYGDAVESRESLGPKDHRFVDAFRNRNVYLLAFSYFTMTSGVWLISFWLPTFIAEFGSYSRMQVGFLTALPFVTAGAFMIVLGRSSDRHAERRWHSAVSAAVGGVALLASVHSSNGLVGVLLLSAATAGIFAATPVLLSIPATMLRGPAAAAGLALISMAGGLGGFLSPYITGVLRVWTGSSAAPVAVVTVALWIGAIVLVTSAPKRGTAPAAMS
jgi:sugar phosphate permease